jgi:hypothetical protein
MTITRLTLALVLLCAPAWAETTSATVVCKDGAMSNAGRGACRGHGGVDKSKAATAGDTAAAEPAGSAATVVCKDGSSSKAGRGACHGHGGVDKTKAVATSEPAATAPVSAAPPAPAAPAAVPQSVAKTTHGGKAATDDPAGAIAKCHDGKYWHGASHGGSCSHHGGVETWLDGSQK